MDDHVRQILAQPASQDALRDLLKDPKSQEVLKSFLQARQNLLDTILPVVSAQGITANSNVSSNSLITASVGAAKDSGKDLTPEQIGDWLQKEYGVIPHAVSNR